MIDEDRLRHIQHPLPKMLMIAKDNNISIKGRDISNLRTQLTTEMTNEQILELLQNYVPSDSPN